MVRKKIVKNSQEFAESIINTVREPLIALDQDLRVVTANRSFYDFFKVKPEETMGQHIYDLGNKQWDIPKLRELLETILPEKTTFDNYEVEHDFATIGRRIMLLNARQIERALGKERIILLAIEDITKRKEIEAGLERTRKELAIIKIAADEVSEYAESIINTVREPLIALDQDLRVVTASRSFYDFFKVKPEETMGQLIYDLGNKQWDIPKLRELLETILPEKTTFDDYEVEHDFATIGRRIMLLNARQIERALGKERIILLAIEDITKRKETEASLEKAHKDLKTLASKLKRTVQIKKERAEQLKQTLRDAEETRDRINAILTSIADGLMVTDHKSRVVLMNPAAEALLGLKFSEIKGKPLHIVIEDQTLRDWIRKALEERKSGYEFNFEILGDQQGRSRILRAKTAKIETESKVRDKMVIIIRDVTIEREVDRMKTEFISTAAHELRTPLTSIQGFSEILITRDNLEPEKRQKYLSYINSQAVSLGKLIGDLLDISRIESGKGFNLYKEIIDMGNSIKEIVESFRSRSPSHSFETYLPEGPLTAFVDQGKLEQLMENLLSNAVKYSPDGGNIHITARRNEEFKKDKAKKSISQPSAILISVEDNGIGMTPDHVKQVFDKFWRADASNKAIEGTGLGMSIVKYIVEAHGGTVKVESEPGKGTAVMIEMPGD